MLVMDMAMDMVMVMVLYMVAMVIVMDMDMDMAMDMVMDMSDNTMENDPQRIFLNKILTTFPLAPRGVLVSGSAHARPSAGPPIDTSGNFPAHMSAESLSNITPNPSEVISEVSEP